ncbi:MAG TPA: ATP-binding protein, partial [Polyangiaceae bacterium]
MSEAQHHAFQAEVGAVLRLVVNSLYSHKEVFIRELVSNASDAIDRLRFESLTQPDLVTEGEAFRILLTVDADAQTLTIDDNGIGMSADELTQNLGTIARSGTREFLKRLEQAREAQSANVQLIGQFGVGFYSAYLVADRVEVISKKAGTNEAHRWSSDGKEGFAVEPAERATHGTTLVLHLKDDQKEFLQDYKLRSLIERYMVAIRKLPFGELVETSVPSEIRNLTLKIFDRSFAITYALEAIAVVIGLAGVTSSFAALAWSRRREFGVLRFLG